MAILIAIITSLGTGMLVALVSYALGVERRDILLAIGFIAAATQLAGLILWYLLAFKARP